MLNQNPLGPVKRNMIWTIWRKINWNQVDWWTGGTKPREGNSGCAQLRWGIRKNRFEWYAWCKNSGIHYTRQLDLKATGGYWLLWWLQLLHDALDITDQRIRMAKLLQRAYSYYFLLRSNCLNICKVISPRGPLDDLLEIARRQVNFFSSEVGERKKKKKKTKKKKTDIRSIEWLLQDYSFLRKWAK